MSVLLGITPKTEINKHQIVWLAKFKPNTVHFVDGIKFNIFDEDDIKIHFHRFTYELKSKDYDSMPEEFKVLAQF